MSAIRLKACPSCRRRAGRIVQMAADRFFAVCDDCDFRVRPDAESREKAAAAWNAR